ncbi:hypothetical protein MMC25_001598 [Agyrium rufum]|nr:hypothetical protein [Agyrium rufum]
MAGTLAAVLLLMSAALVNAQNTNIYPFVTRPDILAPVLDVITYNNATTDPGLIFITPSSPGTTNFDAGPKIYNNQGKLVWSGYKFLDSGLQAFNAEVCQYKGSPHFCFTQFTGDIGGGPGGVRSYSEVFDNTYTPVVRAAPKGTVLGQPLTQDLHEFNVKDGGDTALMTSYVTYAATVTYPACPGSPTTNFTKTGLFTELSLDGKNTTIFQWNAIEHIDPHDTYVCPGDTNVGTGANVGNGFDCHINSVDKDGNGDYLVSGRHVSTVYKVAGLKSPTGLAPGEIIWRLGGKNNTFTKMLSEVPFAPNFNFSYQHHARFRPAVKGISLWNNANDQIGQATAASSSGMSITIGDDNTATLVEMFISPDRQLDSSQGSHQFLPNGNHFLGMGSVPYIYEQTPNYETTFYATWGPQPLQSYRAFKFPWVGKPKIDEIAVFSYALNCSGPATYYASWNGATEIANWKWFTSNTQTGTFAMAAQVQPNGAFESKTQGPFNLYAYAIAYDKQSNVLGRTPTVKTWIPNAKLALTCNVVSCPPGTNYKQPSATCGAPTTTVIPVKSSSSVPVASSKAPATSVVAASPPANKPRTPTSSPGPSSSSSVGPIHSTKVSKTRKTKTRMSSTSSLANQTPSPSPSPSSPVNQTPTSTPKKTKTKTLSPSTPVNQTPSATPTSKSTKTKHSKSKTTTSSIATSPVFTTPLSTPFGTPTPATSSTKTKHRKPKTSTSITPTSPVFTTPLSTSFATAAPVSTSTKTKHKKPKTTTSVAPTSPVFTTPLSTSFATPSIVTTSTTSKHKKPKTTSSSTTTTTSPVFTTPLSPTSTPTPARKHRGSKKVKKVVA